MILLDERMAQGLMRAAPGRRRQAPLRALAAILVAVAFHAGLDTAWLAVWPVVVVAAAALEYWALGPFRPDQATPPVWRALAAFGAIGLSAATFGAVAVPLLLLPGALAPAAAILLLAGAILGTLVVFRGSAPALAAALIPLSAYLVSAPLLDRAFRGDDPFREPFLVAELLFFAAVLLAFLAAERRALADEGRRAELEARRAEAEARLSAKSAYAAMISHELRTPLSAVLAAAEDIRRKTFEPEVVRRAELVSQAGRSMRVLLDDLLDLSKLEAGRMSVEEVVFEPQLLFEDVCLFWRGAAERKGLTLTVSGVDRLPAAVRGDPMRLRQILNNLLSNAVKFTEAGGIRVEVEAAALGPRLALKAMVSDTGRGIPADRLARLFEPFEQGDASVARTHGGTGLGLAISREFARLMGGDLTAESPAGQGARFTLVAALGKAKPAAPRTEPPKPAHEASPTHEGARILVVDDHDMGRRALSVILGPLGARVIEATNGADALKALAGEPFDLVLMDVTMAGVDGIEACRRLRAREGLNRRTPVIAVTGHADPKAAEACLDAGMSGVVAKPVEPRALFEAIEQVLILGERADSVPA